MSGVFDKKTDKINRREERTKKEQQEKKKIRIISIIVVIVFALLVSAAVLINSKLLRRTLPAVTIGGVNFSVAEFNYYYYTTYNEYRQYLVSQLGEDYASSMLPSSSVPHSSQIYDQETGQTWAELFNGYTIDRLSEQVKYFNAAKAAGYTLTDEKRDEMNTEVEDLRSYAGMVGLASIDALLQAYYGPNMNEKCFRKALEFSYTAASYSEHVKESFEYSAGDKAAYYAENKDTLDSFTYRYFLVKAEIIAKDDYETDEEYETVNNAALAEANARAAQITAGISSEEDFIEAAREYNGEDYNEPDSTIRTYPGSWLSGPYQEWLRDETRQYGDVTSVEMTTGAYVVYFVERDHNEYQMASMRQILIMRQEVDMEEFADGEDDPAYIKAFEIMDSVASERAEEAKRLFIEGGATEDRLIELMADYPDDTTPGGYYENITKNQADNKMVKEIEEWLFAPGRKVGDYALIRTEAYGYHLVYFTGYGERYCDHLATEKMRTRDYNTWNEGLEPVEAVKRWAFIFV